MASHGGNHHFRKDLLGSPIAFYERELGRLSRPSRSWASAPCPFHNHDHGKKRRSAFAVRLDTGGFKCLSCDAHGGGIVDFVMLRDHLSFKEAAIKLNAWDAAPSPETVRRLAAQDRERVKQKLADEQSKAERHRERMKLRDYVHTAARIQRETSGRLSELLAGADPTNDSETEVCWHILALVHDHLRECEAAYMKAAGLEHSYGD
jgi:hypothetical protein